MDRTQVTPLAALAPPAPLAEQLGAQSSAALGRAVMASQSVNERDAFPADEIVERLLDSLDGPSLQLFRFVVLVGEEVRLATLCWYCVNHLQIADGGIDGFIGAFWMACRNAGAVAAKSLFRTPDDLLDQQADYQWQVHYKFHDSIVSHAARLIEQRASEETRLTHLKIAERAHGLMRPTAQYAGRAVVARFTGPRRWSSTSWHRYLSGGRRSVALPCG